MFVHQEEAASDCILDGFLNEWRGRTNVLAHQLQSILLDYKRARKSTGLVAKAVEHTGQRQCLTEVVLWQDAPCKHELVHHPGDRRLARPWVACRTVRSC